MRARYSYSFFDDLHAPLALNLDLVAGNNVLPTRLIVDTPGVCAPLVNSGVSGIGQESLHLAPFPTLPVWGRITLSFQLAA